MMPGSAPVLNAGRPQATVVFTDTASATNTGVSSHSFSVSVGSATADRIVVVGVGYLANSANVTVTINGVSAPLVAGTRISTSVLWCELRALEVPTGTTATVVVSSTQSIGPNIGVWAMYGVSSVTPTSVDADIDSPISLSVTSASLGVVVAYSNVDTGVSTPAAYSWTGLTENFDVAYDTSKRFSGASAQTPIGGALSITATTTTQFAAGCVAVFV